MCGVCKTYSDQEGVISDLKKTAKQSHSSSVQWSFKNPTERVSYIKPSWSSICACRVLWWKEKSYMNHAEKRQNSTAMTPQTSTPLLPFLPPHTAYVCARVTHQGRVMAGPDQKCPLRSFAAVQTPILCTIKIMIKETVPRYCTGSKPTCCMMVDVEGV